MSTTTVSKAVLDAWTKKEAAVKAAYAEHPYVNPAVRTSHADKLRDAALRETAIQQAEAEFLSVVVEEHGPTTIVEVRDGKLRLNGEVVSS